MFFRLLPAVLLCVLVSFAPQRGFAQIDTTATQAIIVDGESGAVLLDKGGNDRMPTSSMSKVMTMYLVFEELKRGNLKLTDTLAVSEKAWRMQGSKMFIKVGDQVKVEDLVRGVIIQSGNDATIALAEGVAGTEEAFVEAMNTRAKELGLASSNFRNASGWPDPDHYSTPRDLALLAYRVITDFPEYYHYFSQKEFTYNKIKQQNRDPLLGRVAGADGLKTGHTEVAGYGLIGSAQREGRRVIMVVNGLPDEKARQEESIRLMEWAFRSFERKVLTSKDEEIEKARVWLGQAEMVPLVAEKDVSVLLPKAQRAGIKMSVTYLEPLKAPIRKGDEVGTLKIVVPGQQPQEVKLMAGSDVARLGAFGRARARLGYVLTGEY